MDRQFNLITLTFASYFLSVSGQADLTGAPSNVSVILGTSAAITCGVSGTQQLGEDLQFYKTSPPPSVLLGLNTNLRNATRYNVTGTYTYIINSVLIEDEGKYECVLFPKTLSAYLSVSVPPISTTLSWSNGRNHVQKATPTNLTCVSRQSRPPASHRWYMGSNDITDRATQQQISTDNDGYGDSVSFIEMTLIDSDYYAPMRCVADVPGGEAIQTAELRVLFSGVQGIHDHRLVGLCILPIALIIKSVWIRI